MNSVVSPLRMPSTTTSMPHHHLSQQQPPYHTTRPRHQRHASNPQVLLAASRMHAQQQQHVLYPQASRPRMPQQQMQQPPQQMQYQAAMPAAADHADVFARAHAIAQAQLQIQAQMQMYAMATASQSMYAPPQAHVSASSRLPQQQQQQTLHQLHQRSTSSNSAAAHPPAAAATSAQPVKRSSKSRSRTSSESATSSSSSNASAGSSDRMPRVEWRVAIDPKTKRAYYYHPVTRETTWKKPQELVEKEKREKRQFFSAMEHNIRSKLRSGTWLTRASNNHDDDDAPPQPYRHSDIGMPTTSYMAASSSSERVRNSLSSMDVNSGRKPKTRASLSAFASRSAPTTPDFSAQSAKPSDVSSNQDSTDDDDDDDEQDELRAAASKPPLLFRTLSSYETPVIVDKKTGTTTGGGIGPRLVAIPSPIHERVRLATAMQPRASDLESYAQSTTRPESSDAAQSPTLSTAASTARQPLRRRSNSTSTIYVRMGTMNAPDQDCTIQCVATVLRAHMVEAAGAPIAIDAKFDVFVNRRDRERAAAAAGLSLASLSLRDAPVQASAAAAAETVPSLAEIGAFIKHVFARAQMESECIIMSLIYVERLLKATSGSLQLRASNWRAILFCSMVMASKVWDDLSMCNADFSKIWPELSLKEINELELAYLSAVEYNVRVSAVSYAKYYFHLRSMCATMGMLAAFDESAPLNLDGARKMQVLSEEYQERSKLLPAPRRRSVTITATSIESRAASANKSSKASPAASLEELVHMQVRGAGGTALSGMHRLSSKQQH